MMLVNLSTSGGYGSDSMADPHVAIGGGLLYRVPITPAFGLGAQYRMYPLGDGKFEFGDVDDDTYEHGFSSSIFYHAAFIEASFLF
jgi:hypothetical protein